MIPEAPLSEDPEYLEGFRAAISASFHYYLRVIETGDDDPPPIPAEILMQARLAARHSVELDAVIRRYVAGSALLVQILLEGTPDDLAQSLLRSHGAALELLLSKVSSEHQRERQNRSRTRAARNLALVSEILGGCHRERCNLDYDLNLLHVGVIARGSDPRTLLADLSSQVDSSLLMVQPSEDTVWGWFGRRAWISPEELQMALTKTDTRGAAVAVGEAGNGIAGWRQTHHQAKAALSVALRSKPLIARYADVCLVASAMQDDLLRASLREMYVEPLLQSRDGGVTYLRTLRAYFASHRNGESTAATLNVSRQAVASRLRIIEERLGRPLTACAAHVEAALKLEELGH